MRARGCGIAEAKGLRVLFIYRKDEIKNEDRRGLGGKIKE